ncbi:MAG: hypothetical protein KDK65_02605 [Chlamydiia bacterium]|nr:hypothetical protein [Chlamydiia bacterium]
MDSEQEEPNLTYIDEEEFINEGHQKNPLPFLLLLCIFGMVIALFWGGREWYMAQESATKSPFRQVTNRDFSLFLWQYPHLMRIHAPSKRDYLKSFQYQDKVNIFPGEADQFVDASPELLFHYHTWDRLLKPDEMVRRIPVDEFRFFLNYAEEWKPTNWPEAPAKYASLVVNLPQNTSGDLFPALPLDVRRAFIGWKNYLYEGDQIAESTFTAKEVKDFLKAHPTYQRPLWYNLVKDPSYLKGINTLPDEAQIPPETLLAFLRVALYNAKKTEERLNK